MKTLIINGSPRKQGDTSALLSVLKAALTGEITEISAYYDKISPCIDCRHCWKTGKCAIRDKMDIIYGDDFDNVIIAAPVYMLNLPGPLLSLAGRFQAYYAAKRFLGAEPKIKGKNGALILVGGGGGSADTAIVSARRMLKAMNARLDEEDMIFSLNTDVVPASEDKTAIQNVKNTARKLNGKNSR
ncbi:MAG: flavodoxin family protein [Oscillospiraceae bacterium]|nr:flavodoxin family protein [Oscillospiraceae bacterium]